MRQEENSVSPTCLHGRESIEVQRHVLSLPAQKVAYRCRISTRAALPLSNQRLVGLLSSCLSCKTREECRKQRFETISEIYMVVIYGELRG